MKIQILSLPRTGSSYLRSMLNFQMHNFEDFYTISEPFNESKSHINEYKDKNLIIQKMSKSKNVLVKTHIGELDRIDDYSILEKYCSINWYTICLLRKDIFSMTLSRAIALYTGIWDKQSYDNLKLNIDTSFFKNCLDESIYWIKMIRDNRLNFNYQKIIYYEDLTFDSLHDMKILNLQIAHSTL